ncbi:MAG: ribonuclease P protein component [Puniceicoccales bacterium]|jgi:cytidylate kinase|nr:ribonuclease P protein component [Puniceicoccales bacterium]
MRLKKCQRIRLQSDFDQFRANCIFKNSVGFFCKIRNNLENVLPRFAVIVGKKVGKAHERNYIKRLFREIFRQEQRRLNQKCDYLIVARKDIVPNFYDLKEKFLRMCAHSPKLFLSFAIDGTAASGKSSTALALAEKYRLLNVNTGNHYRTLAFFLLQKGISSSNGGQVVDALQKFSLHTQIDGISAHLTVNGIIPRHGDLHSEIVNKNVAVFAQIPQIRQKLRDYQRNLVHLAKKFSFAGIVMEGRDIASHVLPDADVKIFLTADQEVRENRRRNEGERDAIAQRDSFDHYHENKIAFVIDTTRHPLEQVISLVEENIPSK